MKAKEIDLYDFLMSHRNKFIGIDGAKRTGKTTTLTWMQKLLYDFNHNFEKWRLRQDAEVLRNMGFTDVKPLPYAIYSNYKNHIFIPTVKQQKWHRFKYKFKSWLFKYNKILAEIEADKTLSEEEREILLEHYKFKPLEPLKPFKTKVKDFRIPNEEKPFKHFPYGSWIFWSEELSKALNNVDEEVNYDSYMFEALQQQGHNGITIIAETQLLSRTCMWVKEFIDTQIYIAKRFDKPDYVELLCYLYEGENIVKKFGFNHRLPIDANRTKKMRQNGELDGEDEIQFIKLKIPYEVYNYYNHQEHRSKFLSKLTTYSTEQWDSAENANTADNINKQAKERWRQEQSEREAQIKKQLERKREKEEVKERMASSHT